MAHLPELPDPAGRPAPPPVPTTAAPAGLPGMPGAVTRAELRVSDAEREQTAAILQHAAAQGRLDLHELDERLAAAYAAKTYADLAPLTRDLPPVDLDPEHRAVPVPPGVPVTRRVVGVLTEAVRTGPWAAARVVSCLAFWGGVRLDLRAARYTRGQVKIRAFALMGGVTVVVPEHAEVYVTGVGVMGGFDHQASGAGVPGAPQVVVTGLAFWGGVAVKRRPSEEELRRRREERRQYRRELPDL